MTNIYTDRRIYIASSWKNVVNASNLAFELRQAGHLVDCFCDLTSDRPIYNLEYCKYYLTTDGVAIGNAITFLTLPETRTAFEEDLKWLDWCNVVVMLVPCGKSAHLEAGYAKGQGKQLYIYGDFPSNEYEVMYHFANGLFRTEELDRLKEALRRI